MSSTGRLFLIHWLPIEAQALASRLRDEGWEVAIETEDGATAVRRISDHPPDVVVIDLEHLPSHGRETADALRRLKATRFVPLVLVGGEGETLQKTRNRVPDAIYTINEDLGKVLAHAVNPSSATAI